MNVDLIQGLLVPLLTAAATWGAIRADIRNLHEGVKRAHERIDDLTARRAGR